MDKFVKVMPNFLCRTCNKYHATRLGALECCACIENHSKYQCVICEKTHSCYYLAETCCPLDELEQRVAKAKRLLSEVSDGAR